jgi:hypothetical protein
MVYTNTDAVGFSPYFLVRSSFGFACRFHLKKLEIRLHFGTNIDGILQFATLMFIL